MRSLRTCLWMVAVLLAPMALLAQNNTAATASRVAPNVTLFTTTDDGANAERWYRFGTLANRSYCVETSQTEFNSSGATVNNDSVVEVFSDGAGTVSVGSNDDNGVEPTHQGGGAAFGPSRFCDIVTISGTHQVKLTDLVGGVQNWKLQIHDTTLFSPWFFSGSGFEAFILIKNTTSSPRAVRVVLVSPAGTVLGTQTGTAPANGSLNLQVSDPAGFNLASASGGVIIAHTGPPGGLFANVTSISFGSGVSFDTPASPRQSWRE